MLPRRTNDRLLGNLVIGAVLLVLFGIYCAAAHYFGFKSPLE